MVDIPEVLGRLRATLPDHTVLESSSQSISITDPNGTIVEVQVGDPNADLAEQFEKAFEELLGVAGRLQPPPNVKLFAKVGGPNWPPPPPPHHPDGSGDEPGGDQNPGGDQDPGGDQGPGEPPKPEKPMPKVG